MPATLFSPIFGVVGDSSQSYHMAVSLDAASARGDSTGVEAVPQRGPVRGSSILNRFWRENNGSVQLAMVASGRSSQAAPELDPTATLQALIEMMRWRRRAISMIPA